jgi:hypothetical protein
MVGVGMKVDISCGSGTGFSTVMPVMTFAFAVGCAVSVVQAERAARRSAAAATAMKDLMTFFFIRIVSFLIGGKV